MPPGVKAYILRKISDLDEVIAFGFFDGTKEESRRRVRIPLLRKRGRHRRHRTSRASSLTASTKSSRAVSRAARRTIRREP